MNKIKTYNRTKLVIFTICVTVMLLALIGRLVYLMVFKSEYYGSRALEVQQRERSIKAARGKIIDASGTTVLATNKTVCTVSVIHSQITDQEAVINMLVKELGISEEKVRKRVEKVSSIERIASNIDKETGDKIRAYNLDGVKIDEDYKRYYPFSTLASKVLGFTGADNQGIIGLEVWYDEYLEGVDGKILTLTNSKGIELEGALEDRKESISGNDLYISLDYNIQQYAEQIAYNALEAKEANYVSIIVMNPQNGEIMAMVNAPEFDLNNPFTLNYETDLEAGSKEYLELLNRMWRNQCINDTYEPGSTFKIVTAAAGLEMGVVNIDSNFSCPGFAIVEDRRIRCHKTTGHGAETFLQATMNSCNPVFIEVGLRVGTENFFDYMGRLGLLSISGIDLPGEASTIIHKEEDVGPVELATMSFGQSFQITPIQFLTAASAVINGGTLVTPHFGVEVRDTEGNIVKTFEYETTDNVISSETSKTMQYILEKVISEGTGAKASIEGYSIGGKTATSQKLPRSANKYIASFIGFAPAENPEVIAIAIVDEPQGVYYGGSVAAPLIRELYENILPYLGIEKNDTGTLSDNGDETGVEE
ncbi:MAG: peptidoglycan D,D-transpeptidase FtsI family protein [Eubacterium sp.]